MRQGESATRNSAIDAASAREINQFRFIRLRMCGEHINKHMFAKNHRDVKWKVAVACGKTSRESSVWQLGMNTASLADNMAIDSYELPPLPVHYRQTPHNSGRDLKPLKPHEMRQLIGAEDVSTVDTSQSGDHERTRVSHRLVTCRQGPRLLYAV